MQISYYVVDAEDQLRRVPRKAVEQLWDGRAAEDDLGCAVGDDLRLITVLSDENLMPAISFFVRLELEDGRITDGSKMEAFEAMTAHRRRRYDSPAAQRQFTGWPDDWQHQLAVALDVPADDLRKVGLGGPLVMSELWGVPLAKVIAYFEEVLDE